MLDSVLNNVNLFSQTCFPIVEEKSAALLQNKQAELEVKTLKGRSVNNTTTNSSCRRSCVWHYTCSSVFLSLWGDKVSVLTHTYSLKPLRKIKVTICNHHRLTTNSMCGLMTNLVIWCLEKVRSCMTLNVLTETRCH